MSAVSACWLVMRAVARMNTNGTRNAIDSTMATEWLAIDGKAAAADRGRHRPARDRAAGRGGSGDRGYLNPAQWCAQRRELRISAGCRP